jgi:hypothetical protein
MLHMPGEVLYIIPTRTRVVYARGKSYSLADGNVGRISPSSHEGLHMQFFLTWRLGRSAILTSQGTTSTSHGAVLGGLNSSTCAPSYSKKACQHAKICRPQIVEPPAHIFIMGFLVWHTTNECLHPVVDDGWSAMNRFCACSRDLPADRVLLTRLDVPLPGALDVSSG